MKYLGQITDPKDYVNKEYADSALPLGVSGAAVGQNLTVGTVDNNGVPTSWIPASVNYHLTVTLLSKDGNAVSGATVTVRNGGATGGIVDTKEYNGTPIVFDVPFGMNYYVTATDTTNGHLDAIPATGQITSAENSVTVYYDTIIYSYTIDATESVPSSAVTYGMAATGYTPAAMGSTAFNYGSWENVWFLPKPCMLKYDGTVDYYLDPNDYTKQADGETASDVADFTYGGNAMMEWGQNGNKIWYKIVPDEDHTSPTIYFSNKKIDNDYVAWSFVNNQGDMVDHFYTPIYNGSLDTDGKLRSISDIDYTGLCQSKTAAQEVSAALLNNPGDDVLWYTEVYSDITLINLLLILVGKSLNVQAVYGNGVQGQASDPSTMVTTGTLNDKGLFYGSTSTNTSAVKVFGMENWWGNQWRRFAGLYSDSGTEKYKMTYGTEDGSTATSYSTSSASGYLTGSTLPTTNNFVITEYFDGNQMAPYTVGGTASTYYSDYYYYSAGLHYACRGGRSLAAAGVGGAFCLGLVYAASYTNWDIGSALSCKPLS